MEKEEQYRHLVASGETTRGIATKLGISQCTVRWWLKKFGLRTHSAINGRLIEWNKNCEICQKPFKENPKNYSKCGGCTTKMRRFLVKERAIALLGGKCKRCGFDGHPAALEFHHLEDKKFTVGKEIAIKSWKTIEAELKKCELLCSNCHRIEHTSRTDAFIVEAARKMRKG